VKPGSYDAKFQGRQRLAPCIVHSVKVEGIFSIDEKESHILR